MTYPLSLDVQAGQPTAYQHYNHLRADALRLGNAASDAANLGDLLPRFVWNLHLEYLPVNRVRVPASPGNPVGLVIGGCPVAAAANVDLSQGAAPAGGAAIWYVFAVRSPGSTTFTLDVNTSPVESSTRRVIGSLYFDGSAVLPGSIIATDPGGPTPALAAQPPLCQGRLTLSSAAPVPSGEIPGAGMLYFTPFQGNCVSLFTPNAGWQVHSFEELSLSLSGCQAGRLYDVFLVELAGGQLGLEMQVWTGDNLRAVGLSLLDGVPVKTSDALRRYLGTFRCHAAGATRSTFTSRLVWNLYNRMPVPLALADNSASWTWTTEGWVPMRNQTANRLEFVQGLALDAVQANSSALAKVSAAGSGFARIAIGLNSTSPDPGGLMGVTTSTNPATICACLNALPAEGYNALIPLECVNSGSTATFYGLGGANTAPTGIIARVWG